jgi:2-hydroxychromene-2-carboxylate isomerase
MTENELKEVKIYSDFKSPYAFLAFDPAFALEDKYRIHLKWKPFQLRLKGKGQRSQYSEYKGNTPTWTLDGGRTCAVD